MADDITLLAVKLEQLQKSMHSGLAALQTQNQQLLNKMLAQDNLARINRRVVGLFDDTWRLYSDEKNYMRNFSVALSFNRVVINFYSNQLGENGAVTCLNNSWIRFNSNGRLGGVDSGNPQCRLISFDYKYHGVDDYMLGWRTTIDMVGTNFDLNLGGGGLDVCEIPIQVMLLGD